MSRISRMLRLGLAGLVLAALVGVGTAGGASTTQYSGQATVISGTVAGIPVNIVDTGALPSSGGAAHKCLVAYPTSPDCDLQTVPDQTNGAVSAELLSARTAGQGSHSKAEASTANLSVDLGKLVGVAGLPTLAASFLQAEANAVCKAGVATVNGASQILDVTLGTTSINPDLGPVVVPTPLGDITITFNQVSTSSTGSGGQAVDVKALEISAPFAKTDLVIGFAHADITCGNNPASTGCDDKITGGGWYHWPAASANKAHFALAARAADPSWGHLMYMDKAAGIKFHGKPDFAFLLGSGSSIAATQYSNLLNVSVGQGAAVVSGTNAHPFSYGGVTYAPGTARFIAVAVDNGEGNSAPGDVFGIVLVDAGGGTIYTANATASAGLLTNLLGLKLGGGNVQYHDCK